MSTIEKNVHKPLLRTESLTHLIPPALKVNYVNRGRKEEKRLMEKIGSNTSLCINSFSSQTVRLARKVSYVNRGRNEEKLLDRWCQHANDGEEWEQEPCSVPTHSHPNRPSL